jgi:hypothetical protein
VSDVRHSPTIENAILGSAVVLLIWSKNAACSNEVARHLPFVLDLKKTLLPLLLDQAELPVSLRAFEPFTVQSPCTDIAAQLVQRSLLPAPDSADPLVVLAQLAASHLLSERKAAVRQANAMLQRNEQRASVLAILAYLAKHDPMIVGVREPAEDALDADILRQQAPQTPSLLVSLQAKADDMIGVRCKQCSNVTYFNKHRICKESRRVFRGPGDKDELELTCGSCGAKMMQHVDCEGYK